MYLMFDLAQLKRKYILKFDTFQTDDFAMHMNDFFAKKQKTKNAIASTENPSNCQPMFTCLLLKNFLE